MKYNPKLHNRRSIRLKGYDYSQEGLYFITTCCNNRETLFGEIIEGKMILNDAGRMIEDEWLSLTKRFTNINMHNFVIMPNHFHGILEIVEALVVAQNEKSTRNYKVNQNESKKSNIKTKSSSPENIKNNRRKDKIGNGRPQGYAPTTETDKNGRPQGYVPTTETNRNGRPQGYVPTTETDKNRRPQGYVPTTETDKNGRPQGYAPTTETDKKLGEMIGAFLSITTVNYIKGVKLKNWKRFDGKLWQRNYWEHIIRNDKSYQNISDYIQNNPKKWDDDKLK